MEHNKETYFDMKELMILKDSLIEIKNIAMNELKFQSTRSEKTLVKEMVKIVADIWEYLIKRSDLIYNSKDRSEDSSGCDPKNKNEEKLRISEARIYNNNTCKIKTSILSNNNDKSKYDVSLVKSENKNGNKKENKNNNDCNKTNKNFICLDYKDDSYLNLKNIEMSDTQMNRLRKNKEEIRLQNQQSSRKKETQEISKKKKENGFDSNRTLNVSNQMENDEQVSATSNKLNNGNINKENNENGINSNMSLSTSDISDTEIDNKYNKKNKRTRRKKIDVYICKFTSDKLCEYFDHENKKHKKQDIIKKFFKWNPNIKIENVFLYFKRDNKTANSKLGKYTLVVNLETENDKKLLDKEVIQLDDLILNKAISKQYYFIDVLKVKPSIPDDIIAEKFGKFFDNNEIESFTRNKNHESIPKDSITLKLSNRGKFIELINNGIQFTDKNTGQIERYETEIHPFNVRHCKKCSYIGHQMDECRRKNNLCAKCTCDKHLTNDHPKDKEYLCINCKRKHASTSLACPNYKLYLRSANQVYIDIIKENNIRSLVIEKIIKDANQIMKDKKDYNKFRLPNKYLDNKQQESDEEELNIIETIKKMKLANSELNKQHNKLKLDFEKNKKDNEQIVDTLIDTIEDLTEQNKIIKNDVKNAHDKLDQIEISGKKFMKAIKINGLERVANWSYQEEFLRKLAESTGAKSITIESQENRLKRLCQEAEISDDEDN